MENALIKFKENYIKRAYTQNYDTNSLTKKMPFSFKAERHLNRNLFF